MNRVTKALILFAVLILALVIFPYAAVTMAQADPQVSSGRPQPAGPSFQEASFSVVATPPVTPTVTPTPNSFYLPLAAVNAYQNFAISGRVVDSNNNPLAAVEVKDNTGRSVLTDSNGNYVLSGLPPGDYALAPSLGGYMFLPSVQMVSVPAGGGTQNFMAMAACADLVANGGFEVDSAWEFPATEYSASYSTDGARSGARSARTGIVNPAHNRYSYSSTRQLITVPSGVTSATLRMWLFPISGESPALALAARPEGTEFGAEALANDVQYVLVLDAANNMLETLLWQRTNAFDWTLHEFNLTKYAGRTIKIQAGTYNDGVGGATAMYVDDVSLEACSSTIGGTPTVTPLPTNPPPPTTTPGACVNRLGNPSFETDSVWNIPVTAYKAAYSTDVAYSGVRSMRTGVVNPAHNRYSYSDAWQLGNIPSSSTSATLRMWIYAQSSEVSTNALMPTPNLDVEFGTEALAGDVQYVLVLNQAGYILDSLLWQRSNARVWQYLEFDMSRYIGQTIRLQFGTYNDGSGGITAMYVDDISLDTCPSAPPVTAVPTATPQPGTCYNPILNSSFEQVSNWQIPITAFSAGYSTVRANTGAASMRTGIVYQAHNRYSYSDFRQQVTLPTKASKMLLRFWVFPSSGEGLNVLVPEKPLEGVFANATLTNDVQYLLVLDAYGNWIDTLLWQRRNSQVWTPYEINLAGYAGRTIKLQFGTYNDGWGGVTSMYVDDVTMEICP